MALAAQIRSTEDASVTELLRLSDRIKLSRGNHQDGSEQAAPIEERSHNERSHSIALQLIIALILKHQVADRNLEQGNPGDTDPQNPSATDTCPLPASVSQAQPATQAVDINIALRLSQSFVLSLSHTASPRHSSDPLRVDINADSHTDNGSERFGDRQGAGNGVAERAKFGANGDSLINVNDRVYATLRQFNTRMGARASLTDAAVNSIRPTTATASARPQDSLSGARLTSLSTIYGDGLDPVAVGALLLNDA